MPLPAIYQHLIAQFEFYFGQEQYALAAEKMHEAINCGAKSARHYACLGHAYCAMEVYTKAAKYFAIAAGYSPNNTSYWVLYSKMLHKSGETAEAARILTHAQSIEADWEGTLHNLSGDFEWLYAAKNYFTYWNKQLQMPAPKRPKLQKPSILSSSLVNNAVYQQ